MTSATACGKAILVGEHAVVYGSPGIAVPMSAVRAQVTVHEAARMIIKAPDLRQEPFYGPDRNDDEARPLWVTLENVVTFLGRSWDQVALEVTIHSEVPVARGMGSGTAVATAVVRAVAAHWGQPLSEMQVSELVYRTEVLLHGTPSGIDNTVVAFERPVYFVRGQAPEPLEMGSDLELVVADTGIVAHTRRAVDLVKAARQRDKQAVDGLIAQIGQIAEAAREAMRQGNARRLGHLMDQNQLLLEELGVSSPELDALVAAAKGAGALGAKLSGGGLGGCMIALVLPENCDAVAQCLLEAGAKRAYQSTLAASGIR